MDFVEFLNFHLSVVDTYIQEFPKLREVSYVHIHNINVFLHLAYSSVLYLFMSSLVKILNPNILLVKQRSLLSTLINMSTWATGVKYHLACS